MHARWYDPGSGRFTQVDPFAGVLELPGTQHPYAYGLNNPLTYTDPSGKSVLGFIGASALWGIVAGLLAAGAEATVQILPYMQQGYSLHRTFECLNWGKIGGAFVNAFLSTFLMLLLMGVLPGAGGAAMYTFWQVALRFLLSPIFGAATSIVGDFYGRMVEIGINRLLGRDATKTFNNITNGETYVDDALWGGGFGLFGGVMDILTQGIKVLSTTALGQAAAARRSLPALLGRAVSRKAFYKRLWFYEAAGAFSLAKDIPPVPTTAYIEILGTFERAAKASLGLRAVAITVERSSNTLGNSTFWCTLTPTLRKWLHAASN